MKPKEFFKPTWGKLILLLIFFPILFFILDEIGAIQGSGISYGAYISLGAYYWTIIELLASPFNFLAPYTPGLSTLLIDLPLQILNYVYLYVFACLINWIYHEVRKK